MLIQRNLDGSNFFNRTWTEFKEGFGNGKENGGNFWIGNDVLHLLTKKNAYKLRFELQASSDEWYWAEYKHFRVNHENEHYKLEVSGFSGNVGYDGMSWSNGRKFTTHDQDHDERVKENCATTTGGGFWYSACHMVGVNAASSTGYFQWWNLPGWKGLHELKSTRMWLMSRKD